jgi:hypothetical protein
MCTSRAKKLSENRRNTFCLKEVVAVEGLGGEVVQVDDFRSLIVEEGHELGQFGAGNTPSKQTLLDLRPGISRRIELAQPS